MSALAQGRFRFAPILAATVITILLLWMVMRTAGIFLLLFVAVLVAMYLREVAQVLVKHAGMPMRLALIISTFGTLAAIVGLGWLIIPPTIEQTQALLRGLPGYAAGLENMLETFASRVPALRGVLRPGENTVTLAIYDQVAGYFSGIVPRLFSLLHLGISIVSVAIMAIYLAVSPGHYRELLIVHFPPVHRDLVRNVLADLAVTLRRWIIAQLTAMVLLAVATSIGLWLLGVPYWLTFGVFTGAVAIIPFFGTLVATLLPTLFVLSAGAGTGHALAVAGFGIGVHLLEGNVVSPLLMQHQRLLPPVLTVMAVLIFGTLLGPIGLVVGVPALAIVMVIVRRILISRIYEGQGFRKTVRDAAFLVRAPVPDDAVLVPDQTNIDPLAGAEPVRQPQVA